MGSRAAALFEEALKLGGLAAETKLASMIGLESASEAKTIDDTEDVVQRIEWSLAKIRERLLSGGRISTIPASSEVVQAPASEERTRALRRQLREYVELMAQRSLLLGDVSGTIRRINEAASRALDVERVSVWALADAGAKITCLDLFVRSRNAHEAGMELLRHDYPPYFEALEHERTIAAHDAHGDPRTECFSSAYLRPLGITSMLDVPIWVRGQMAAVVCHEHVGPSRHWDTDEESFAYLMSNFVAMAMSRRADLSQR